MEKESKLLNYNRKICSVEGNFSYTLDSVLLANFIRITLSSKKILDIGTGIGTIPLILSLRTNKKIEALELQKDVALLCQKNVSINNLSSQIEVINDDVKSFSLNKNNLYDIISCNPPYYEDIDVSTTNNIKVSKHEKNITLDDLLKAAKKMLKNQGKLFLVYNCSRYIELIDKLKEYNLWPKRIMFVHYNLEKKASMFLVEAIKNGKKRGMIILPPLVLYDSNNELTDGYKKILLGGFLYESEEL